MIVRTMEPPSFSAFFVPGAASDQFNVLDTN